MTDKNVESVKRLLDERAARGLKKYGVTTERTDLSQLDWLRHLQAELLDGAIYAQRLIANAIPRFTPERLTAVPASIPEAVTPPPAPQGLEERHTWGRHEMQARGRRCLKCGDVWPERWPVPPKGPCRLTSPASPEPFIQHAVVGGEPTEFPAESEPPFRIAQRLTASWAKRFNDSSMAALTGDIEKAISQALSASQAEVERLKAVIAQHDLCHDLHGKVDARAFADGCAAEQRKLYGNAPDADEVQRLTTLNAELLKERDEAREALKEVAEYDQIVPMRTRLEVVQGIARKALKSPEQPTNAG